ncbi:MAG: MFS transporter [Bacteroidetes bacterium]|nr:MFS transporter [Bacteroidota bacterium]MBU1718070.1 MFS transporter [Bacteroidota bacterium]
MKLNWQVSDASEIRGNRKIIRGWIMYDWANSVYQLTIASAIFPVYFQQVTSFNADRTISFFGLEVINSVAYSWAIALAYFVVALLSPIMSAIADFTGRRKMFMRAFTLIGAVSSASLFFFDQNHIEVGLIAFFLGTLGYTGGLVFYNSFLPVIAAPEQQDSVSARGYSMGYLGGVILLVMNLVLLLFPKFFGITDPLLPAKISFLTVGLWWFGFSMITFSVLPKYTFGENRLKSGVISGAYRELRTVFREIRKHPDLFVYLGGFFFMVMGVITVMFMAATYGEKALHIPTETLISTILLIQLLGMAGAYLTAWISKKIGNILILSLYVPCWVGATVLAYFITDATGFMVVAVIVGLLMGGTQALLRSGFSRMLPETHDHTSYFSFYDVLEKLATVGGMFFFGLAEAITGDMHTSVLMVVICFVLAMPFFGFLLFRAKKQRHL